MTYAVSDVHEFQNCLFSELNFSPYAEDYRTLYTNQNLSTDEYLLLYERPTYYQFGVANYTIPRPFSIQFDNANRIIRFGIVYQGTTEFQLENSPLSTFTPNSFFVLEENIKGCQYWNTGQHFRGAEITIFENYLTEVIEPLLQKPLPLEELVTNYTYCILPQNIISILETMQSLSKKNELNPLLLESFILSALSTLLKDMAQSSLLPSPSRKDNKVQIGTDRYLYLTQTDITKIKQAHQILSEQFANPPTIDALSEQVLMPSQKLKAGFSHHYQQSIGQFITSKRMNLATELLHTTDFSIAEIAKLVGYHYPSSFIKMFRQTYHCTPREYRYQK